MMDLNALIPPGSGMQLTNAFNINDREEILAKAAPLGFTPNDDEDLGHLVLLVPCYADDGDCAVGGQSAIAASPRTSASPLKSPTITTTSLQHPLTPRERLAAWRARLARQYHFPQIPILPPK
jgi:hypothetical protein